MIHVSQSRWSRIRCQILLGIVAILIAVVPLNSVAQPHPWEKMVATICIPKGVPKALALAVIDLESKANPLAVAMAGNGSTKGFLPQDPRDARAILDHALRQTHNVGVGLMQITYCYHEEAMAPDPHRFFDPATNLDYGCQYLAELLKQPGPLWQRIGRYHSASNPANQEAYAKRVLKRMRWHMRHQNGGRSK